MSASVLNSFTGAVLDGWPTWYGQDMCVHWTVKDPLFWVSRKYCRVKNYPLQTKRAHFISLSQQWRNVINHWWSIFLLPETELCKVKENGWEHIYNGMVTLPQVGLSHLQLHLWSHNKTSQLMLHGPCYNSRTPRRGWPCFFTSHLTWYEC